MLSETVSELKMRMSVCLHLYVLAIGRTSLRAQANVLHLSSEVYVIVCLCAYVRSAMIRIAKCIVKWKIVGAS